MATNEKQHCAVCGLPVEDSIQADVLGPQEQPGVFPIRQMHFHPACGFGHAVTILEAIREKAWEQGRPMRELAGPPPPPPPG